MKLENKLILFAIALATIYFALTTYPWYMVYCEQCCLDSYQAHVNAFSQGYPVEALGLDPDSTKNLENASISIIVTERMFVQNGTLHLNITNGILFISSPSSSEDIVGMGAADYWPLLFRFELVFVSNDTDIQALRPWGPGNSGDFELTVKDDGPHLVLLNGTGTIEPMDDMDVKIVMPLNIQFIIHIETRDFCYDSTCPFWDPHQDRCGERVRK